MPGPGNKRKPKAKANADTKTPSVRDPPSTHTSQAQCLTLDEDEITRCNQPATDGYPKPERCKVHHGQYRILYKNYKDASKVVDEVKRGSELPTQEQIGRYTDWRAVLQKERWVRKYLEAIRVEKTGREIHQKRFFLKVDDGHRRRLKLLEREMVRAVDVLDALQARAYQLYKDQHALYDIDEQALPTVEVEMEKRSRRTAEEVLKSISDPDAFHDSTLRVPRERVVPVSDALGVGDEDLIHLSLRDQKERMIKILKPFIDLQTFTEVHVKAGNSRPKTEYSRSMVEKQFFIYQQFIRRIIFHQPTLFMKSIEKVSFKDLILSDDFSMEDLFRFLDLFLRPLGFPLRWFKDAVLDALAMSRHGTAANAGSVESRFPLLGGWVFNRAHSASMSNEAWWHLLTILQPPGNMENRFVRLCNNFDDLIGFLSFGAFGFVPGPDFCLSHSAPKELEECLISRNHLSLSGIIVADIVGSPRPPEMCGPVPTTRRGTKRNCIIWAEVQSRAYMFGAVRNERDAFLDAFLRELRARPDLFQVVLRPETAPSREVEMFGSGPSNSDALPATRVRQFEAPPSPSPPSVPPATSWEVAWSAIDVLYGSWKEPGMMGYLTMLARDLKGWFFRFKTFPVTYFVILDTVPYRDKSVLARNVAWAALRAEGYADGEYTLRKYAVASDKLLDRCSKERFGWIPNDIEWNVPRMKDCMNSRGM